MPKTKLQDIVFSIMMAIAMTYAMELYNLSLLNKGLTNQLFLEVFQDMFFMAIIVVLLEKLIAGRTARKLAFRFMTPGIDKPIFVTLAIQCFTICLMSPMMSLVATLLFKHPGSQILAVWLQTLVFNLPFAFFWQIFFAGPLVRFLFRVIFKPSTELVMRQD